VAESRHASACTAAQSRRCSSPANGLRLPWATSTTIRGAALVVFGSALAGVSAADMW